MLIDNASIVANDYNLSVSTYVEKEDTREKIDIIQLNKDIAETVKILTVCVLRLTRLWRS